MHMDDNSSSFTSISQYLIDNITSTMLPTNVSSSSNEPSITPANGSDGIIDILRSGIITTHLTLVLLGTFNLLVACVILAKPNLRTTTNTFIVSLCIADFIYVSDLLLVAVNQMNKYWPFNTILCTMYHGTESTGKFASVIFVVLLSADRYCAMCKRDWLRYRTPFVALSMTVFGWLISIIASLPLYWFAHVMLLTSTANPNGDPVCLIQWPDKETARWYLTLTSVLIFLVPLIIISFCYYHIFIKLREGLKSNKRLKRNAISRAPYARVTRMVLIVILCYVICWAPFWLFNLYKSIKRNPPTPFDRVFANIIHLCPYVNCAINPFLYAANSENFFHEMCPLFCRRKQHRQYTEVMNEANGVTSTSSAILKITSGVKTRLGGSLIIGSRKHKPIHPRISSAHSSGNETASERLLSTSVGTSSCPIIRSSRIASAENRNDSSPSKKPNGVIVSAKKPGNETRCENAILRYVYEEGENGSNHLINVALSNLVQSKNSKLKDESSMKPVANSVNDELTLQRDSAIFATNFCIESSPSLDMHFQAKRSVIDLIENQSSKSVGSEIFI